ncbi:MAG: hypothetical protein C5B51_32325 [Terriglobia bacterium]|nr:MAG: hypothetical protein C5B51_32325 [Terriglobia bacterium]
MDREMGPIDRQEMNRPGTEPDQAPRSVDAPSRDRRPMLGRNYAYFLSQAEMETMKDIGRFRTIALDDLAQIRYHGNQGQNSEDLRSLQDQGLLARRTIWTGGRQHQFTVLVLTEKGKALLEQEGQHLGQQKVYAGFVKPREVHHDAAIYRMYQAEAGKIERSGGRIRRVVLDYELKQRVYRPLAKARAKPGALGSAEYAKAQAEVARANQLRVVHGKILLPDLRIEYDTANGERAHVDLELATHHYRGASLRAKAEAGFKMYAPQGSLGGSIPYDPEHVAEIFSF